MRKADSGRMKNKRVFRRLLRWAAAVAAGLCVVAGVRLGLGVFYRAAYPLEYAPLVEKACREQGLDPAFVYALIRTESSFNPQAVSGAGARGLMQMMPDAFEWVRMRTGSEADDYESLFDPEFSVDYGTRMLRLLFDEFESERNVLCAYHAGWGNAKRWLKNPDYAPDGENIEVIPFPDTAHYVSKVTNATQMYRKLYDL